jgi:hypothetical protein
MPRSIKGHQSEATTPFSIRSPAPQGHRQEEGQAPAAWLTERERHAARPGAVGCSRHGTATEIVQRYACLDMLWLHSWSVEVRADGVEY